MEIKKGDIMVCEWGYSMRLVDFVEVVSISPKSIVTESLAKKGVDYEDESYMMDGVKYEPEYGRPWVTPFKENGKYVREHIQRQHGELEKIRLYQCETLERLDERTWFSRKAGFLKIYELWDGKPIQEDHND